MTSEQSSIPPGPGWHALDGPTEFATYWQIRALVRGETADRVVLADPAYPIAPLTVAPEAPMASAACLACRIGFTTRDARHDMHCPLYVKPPAGGIAQ